MLFVLLTTLLTHWKIVWTTLLKIQSVSIIKCVYLLHSCSTELTAALLGARLCHYVEGNLPFGFRIGTKRYFSDSQVALAWICSQKNVWKPYVTNRVHETCNLITPDQWYYLSTSDNPADLLTRTDRVSELLSGTSWTEGQSNLEEIPFRSLQISDPNEERKSEDNLVAEIIDVDPEVEISCFSSYKRMKRVFSWIHHLITKKRSLISCGTQGTESRLILRSQAIWFSSEVNALRKDGRESRSSKIIKFRPFLDPNGFLRLGGRLDFALFSPEEKHPTFLHPSSKLTEHIILDSHLETNHGEVGEVLYHLRH
uniref:Uncharacterized protein n=1 Tax=Strigamia maritima TaxID=126957 RepID=T1IH62_STRMM